MERSGTRDGLAGLLWPESPPKNARHSLNQALHELRKELGEEWVDGAREVVQVTRSLECDAVRFTDAVESGRYQDALAAYGGPFLGGLVPQSAEFEGWVERQRLRLERLRKKAFRALVDEHRVADRTAEALETARAWVDADPLDDEANHALIELLAEAGRRADALRQYDRFADVLAREMELTPVDDTKALVEKIRAAEVVAKAEAPAGRPSTSMARRPMGTELAELQERFNDAFQLLRLIGEGSMSTVHLAREPALKRLVALKVLRSDLAQDTSALKRFEREAQSLAGVLHPNIVPIFRVGLLSTGLPYLVLPYLRGVNLAERVRALGPPAPADVRRMMRDLASALAAAHRINIVHRDVRPENIMVEDETGRPWLTDFGIAALIESTDPRDRLTRTGEQLGQPGYISPEQIHGAEVSGRTDVYSLGVLGISLLSGQPPRLPGALPQTMIASAHSRDAELTELLTPCLAENARHRPDAATLVRKIDALTTGQPAAAPNVFQGLRERRMPLIVGSVFGASVVGMGIVDQLVQNALLPRVVYPLGLVTALAGLLAALVVSWFHGKPGPQPVRAPEVMLLVAVGVGWILSAIVLLTS
ncbi:MAG: protein kinase [Gemmatimonadota bacterium]